MKLLLVHPNFDGVVTVPSLGLGFIASHVQKNSKCDVEVVEPRLQGLTEAQVLDKARDADIVGLVCYTESRFQCFRFAEKVKQINPECKVIVGGPHVNTLDELICRTYPFIDAACRGESEDTVLDIVKGAELKNIPGLTFRSTAGIVKNIDRPLRPSIDGFTYDYNLVYKFLEQWRDPEIPFKEQKGSALPIIASRGCPFQCTFCAAHAQWCGQYRGLDPVELVNRVEELTRRYGIKYFRFYDALFIGSDERIMTFCDLLIKRKLNITFRIDIRVGSRKNTLRRLREAGCSVVGLGIESGSDRILERVRKQITRQRIIETVADCREMGFWILGFFMIALPDETIEDITQTFSLLRLFNGTNLQIFKIHPNTAVYEELKRKGHIDDGVWFDEKAGAHTRYGNEFYYCKESFPEARFALDDLFAIARYAFVKFNAQNPRSIIVNRGLVRGVSLVMASMLAAQLLSPWVDPALRRAGARGGA